VLELLGRYQVQERIGQGAMADVYRAYDPGIDRVLAIKVLKGEVRQNPEYVARFLREARAAGALSHPSIVTVYDVGEAEGYPYIAMELLDGEPLDEALKDQAGLPVEDVLAIGVQLAEALAYAHAQGVVHRDIKPSNIIINRQTRAAKILDFGIARFAESANVENDESLKTQIGQVMGTPRYMSPEQVLGEEIDGRSDLFSVGVVLYELITGQRAFNGANAATLALQIVQSDPRPIPELSRQTPAGLQFIIGKLLSKRRDRRYATGAELVLALQREQAALVAATAEGKDRRVLPMSVRLTLAMALITAATLAISSWGVLHQQYRAMETMALSSGAGITTFVASNAALSAAENAGLDPAEQDWAPVAAFVHGASTDPNVRRMVVVGADGVVRAASQPALVGQPYRSARGETFLRKVGEVTVTDIDGEKADSGFRFVRPILYAGRPFGLVDVSLNKAELVAAASLARWLMAGLALVLLGVVAAVSYAGARFMSQPMLRLKAALNEAAKTGEGMHISHDRRDEFGQLFDSFNRFSDAVTGRLEAAQAATPAPAPALPAEVPSAFAPDATRIAEKVEAALDRTQLLSPGDDALRTIIRRRSPAKKNAKAG
jgi:tRNA A-37 threonylcarbamoyl transferase component Bud32